MFMFHLHKIGLILYFLGAFSATLWADISEQRLPVPLQSREFDAQQSIPPTDLSASPAPAPDEALETPYDLCLPPLFRDWQEFSRFRREASIQADSRVRVVIDRTMFSLVLEEIDVENTPHVMYQTEVALGNLRSPTPEGSFIINHIYCYPDVVFFTSTHERVSNLYNGFFAPLLRCDASGRCDRFNDLGIHGFYPDARPDQRISPDTFGAVSGGCIRLPDPCAFKRSLILTSSLGPRKINERGSYHWLKKPIEVLIVNGYPTENPNTLFNIFIDSFGKLEKGLGELLRGWGR